MPLVQIHLLEGRSPEQKESLLRSVTDAVHESTGAPLERIRVWIHELPLEHYMIAGETAAARQRRE